MDYVIVGKIVNTRGLKGTLKVISNSSFIEERFKKGSKLYIDVNGELVLVEVLRSSKDPKFVYVAFKDHEDINLVEKYKGFELKFPIKDLKPLEEDNYYYHELNGCEVFLNDKLVGTVVSVEENNKRDMIRIKNKEGKEHLVLFMKQFIKDVDVAGKKIYLNDVEGLL